MLKNQPKTQFACRLLLLLLLASLCPTTSWGGEGDLMWFFPTGDIVWSSPATDTYGTTYVGSADNNLYAINYKGGLKWAFPTGGAVFSSPAIGSDGTIYVGSFDNNLYAINHTYGSEKWRFETGDWIYSSPAIGADGTIYVGSNDNNIAGKGKPWENPFAESAIGHLKDELVWLEEYTDFQQAYSSLSHFLDVVYNHERPHSSLGYLTPAEFEAQFEAEK